MRTFFNRIVSLRWVAIARRDWRRPGVRQRAHAGVVDTHSATLPIVSSMWRALSATSGDGIAWFIDARADQLFRLAAGRRRGHRAGVGVSLKQVLNDIQLIPRSLTGSAACSRPHAWRGPVVSWLARYGRYGYGVYLCHVLIVEPIHVTPRTFILRPSVRCIMTFACAFAGSLALVRVLGRSSRLRW